MSAPDYQHVTAHYYAATQNDRAMQRRNFIREAKTLYFRGMNRELWVAPIPGLPCFT